MDKKPDKPLPFIIENEGKLILNEEVLSLIQNANNPKFISFYGNTRKGKSTTLNQLIKGRKDKEENLKFDNPLPFQAGTSQYSITSGCDIYGPIKFSDLKDKHLLSNINQDIKEDFDIFFCDTEGIGTLQEFHKHSIPGILIILQICTMSVFMVPGNIETNHLKEICSLIQFSKVLNKQLKLNPKIAVYIADMQTNEEPFDEQIDFNNFPKIKENYKEYYEESIDSVKDMVIKKVNEKYSDLNYTKKDLEIIAGGPYIKNEPNPQKDWRLAFYWCSIHAIFETFLNNYRAEEKQKKKEKSKIDIVKLIRTLFEVFSTIDKLNDDFDLKTFLNSYLENKFDKYSQEKYSIKLKKIKEDIKSNFLMYMDILNDEQKAKDSLDDCFEKEMVDVYKQLIKQKYESFIKYSLENYRKFIKEQIDVQFNSISENILSPKNVESLIKDIIENINKAEFKEDINMEQINNIDKFWNIMYDKNKEILNYFKETKGNILNNLKENFISVINKIIQKLLSNKITWTTYCKDSLIEIEKEINKNYLNMLKKCNYKEDTEKYIQKSSDYFNTVFPSVKEKYFKSLSETRLKEVQEKIQQICNQEYNKIIENKLPSWSKIKKDTKSRIIEILEPYLNKIFKGIQFRNQIDPSLGRKDTLINLIPLEVKENPEIKEDKKEEINTLIGNLVNKIVKIFEDKRKSLPLFEEFMNNLIKTCTKIIDDKIKEIINKFYYLEEKIIFNSDNIFTLLTGDQKIYKNCSSKIEEVNMKLRELCNDKSKEYDLLVEKTKPEWNKIKSNKLSKASEMCSQYLRKIFKNADFQDDIKELEIDKLKKIIIESNNFYDGVHEKRKNELNSEIDKIISQTEDKINSKKSALQNWNSVKSQLLQKAYIEMTNKSKTNLNTKDSSKIIEILVTHIETIPKFFDQCKTEKRKSELISELKSNARPIAEDYIRKIEEEERRRREEEERERRYRQQLEEAEERRREAERRAEEAERRRRAEEAERRRREEENRRRQDEENRRRRDEENRRRQEEENRRRQEEENRRRQEEEHRNLIEDLANKVRRGDYGYLPERQRRLGPLFKEVQNRVNEMCGSSFRYK